MAFYSKSDLNLNNEICPIGTKWIKTEEKELQFLVKISENKWEEYQDGIFFAEFTEISYRFFTLILKTNDGAYIKLTDKSMYYGFNYNRIDNFIAKGKWEVKNLLETQVPNQSSDFYKMNNKNRGLAIIIENHKFKTFHDLPGQDKDVKNYTNTFSRLKFNVKVYHNKKAEEMTELMEKYGGLDYSDHDCFLAVFLTHGGLQDNKELIYGTDEIGLTKENIIRKFKRNPTLFEKPKIFFFDACRGANREPTFAKSNNVDENETFFSQSDFFFGFSSQRFYVSIATAEGSIYSTFLCNAINEHAHSHHLADIVTIAHRKIKEKYPNVTAELQHSLKKFCYFN